MARAKRSYRSTARSRRGAITEFGSRTDIGCVRDHNEDSLVVAPPLFAVADGMGGHAAGEVASEIATTALADQAPKEPDAEALGRAIEAANHAIIEAARNGLGREGMGTTCTAAILKGERLVLAQVGDSRAYLLHQGKLQQLTRDHSLVAMMVEAGQLTPEEARVHPRRSVITRALGTDPATKPDLYELDVETGDRLLLCSDGLSGMVEDRDIEAIMNRTADPQRCASQLVNEAIAAGGNDNVTVIVADVTGQREAKRRKMALKTKLGVAAIIVILIALFAAVALGANAFVRNSAYLAEDDGNVAIYQGLPEPFLMFSYSELVEKTDIPVDQLSPGVASRIREGMRVDNVDAARALVEDYREQLDPDNQQTPADADAASTGDDADGSSSPGATSSGDAAAENELSSGGSPHLGATGSNAVTPDDVAREGSGA
ncbi:MAG: Stp1/IreP family PP2C-type Ser/Thr phosphatase [Eggerthellaceae bacterium]|nr:Stp1/IreP family PP2C-type Ser/Thr phosphatase [Eggerthellaceae bacterium]